MSSRMMKRIGLLGAIGMIFVLAAAVFLALCIFTDMNDGVFLPLALGCNCVGGGTNLAAQLKYRKHTAKQDEDGK